jgi:psiF repeat
MKIVLFASLAAYLAFASETVRAEADCAAQAVARGVHSSGLDAFLAQCQSKAAAVACEGAATEKKLEGKARKAFVKDCAKDTTGK